ncbi:NAD(P)-binding protein [Trichoderma citrinoviride]|uniref:NAD(P)-binding protein n=1 Tax=Trichoderma citrinoviride TaxID=58853 RepID=A0A2T4B2X1_9HYPO|nr:NAD(P)-binding protein [Trichoderma citrinoviride]PTB63675.1 NAD(P)-binding protein [Trichoderma citrinoviride]
MASLPKDYFVASLQYTKNVFQDVYPAIDPSKPTNSLAGRIAIVTGASRGIGARGIVPSLAKAGPHGLVLVARDEAKLQDVEKEVHRINPAVETLLVALDITSEAAVASLFDKIKARYGRHADILVNNAGVNVATNKGGPTLHEASVDEWWLNFEINVKGFFIVSKYFISALPTPTTPATIINISTSGAWLVYPIIAPYSVSKLASQQWCTHLHAAYGDTLNVVSIHPGLVDTDMNKDFLDFDLDSPTLTGGLCVWIAADPARSGFLGGRVISANWDVEELVARKDEIVAKNELRMDLVGKFGREQFETA